MPLGGSKPFCKYCESQSSVIWRKDLSTADYICQSCFIQQPSSRQDSSGSNNKSKIGNKLTKSSHTRQKSARSKVFAKGKNRRNIFKPKSTTKVERNGNANVTSESIFYRGMYFQQGDIVSVIDEEDGRTYYAQCNCFMTNKFCEKFVSFTWLLPIRKIKYDEGFQPSLFYLGPADDIIHTMESVQFVCHAPSDYYLPLQSLYPTFPSKQAKNYLSVYMWFLHFHWKYNWKFIWLFTRILMIFLFGNGLKKVKGLEMFDEMIMIKW